MNREMTRRMERQERLQAAPLGQAGADLSALDSALSSLSANVFHTDEPSPLMGVMTLTAADGSHRRFSDPQALAEALAGMPAESAPQLEIAIYRPEETDRFSRPIEKESANAHLARSGPVAVVGQYTDHARYVKLTTDVASGETTLETGHFSGARHHADPEPRGHDAMSGAELELPQSGNVESLYRAATSNYINQVYTDWARTVRDPARRAEAPEVEAPQAEAPQADIPRLDGGKDGPADPAPTPRDPNRG